MRETWVSVNTGGSATVSVSPSASIRMGRVRLETPVGAPEPAPIWTFSSAPRARWSRSAHSRSITVAPLLPVSKMNHSGSEPLTFTCTQVLLLMISNGIAWSGAARATRSVIGSMRNLEGSCAGSLLDNVRIHVYNPPMCPSIGPALEVKGTADQIADLVRAAIEDGRLAPGAPLHQAELAAQFGMSRIPVR